jgi:hypothetical protein
MIAIDISRERRSAIFDGTIPVTLEEMTFQVPEGLPVRELHFGYAAWNYQTYLGGRSTFSAEWIFYKRNSETMRLVFGNNGQGATNLNHNRQTMPPFAAYQFPDPLVFGDGGDPSNLPLLSGHSPSLNPNSLYWPVQDATSPHIQAGIITAPLRFVADVDRVTARILAWDGTDWWPAVNTAGTGWAHFVAAIVSKAM